MNNANLNRFGDVLLLRRCFAHSTRANSFDVTVSVYGFRAIVSLFRYSCADLSIDRAVESSESIQVKFEYLVITFVLS